MKGPPRCIFLKNEIYRFFMIRNFSYPPPPSVGGYKSHQIEMPKSQEDTRTQIALSQLCDRRPTSLLGGKNDKKRRFFFLQKRHYFEDA